MVSINSVRTSCHRLGPDPLTPGTLLLGRYVLERVLAETPSNTVYLAHERWSYRKVVIKRMSQALKPAGLSRSRARAAFRQEAGLLARLDHPQLPRLYGVMHTVDDDLMALEYIPGVSLNELINQGTLSPEQALRIFDGLCDVIKYLHQQPNPIIHADIKPSNVRVTPNGRVVILDFGLARQLLPARSTNEPMGTIGYAPREQLQGQALNEQSDIYPLGMLANELFMTVDKTPMLYWSRLKATELDWRKRFPSVDEFRKAVHTELNLQLDRQTRPLGNNQPTLHQRPLHTHSSNQFTQKPRHSPSSNPLTVWLCILIALCGLLLALSSSLRSDHVATTLPISPLMQINPGSAPSSIRFEANQVAAAKQVLSTYQERRVVAIAEQDISLLGNVVGGMALKQIQVIISTHRQAGAHLRIIPEVFTIVNVRSIGSSEVDIVSDKIESRLLYPAGCQAPDDVPPCATAHPITVHSERYRVQYRIVEAGGQWEVEGWSLVPMY